MRIALLALLALVLAACGGEGEIDSEPLPGSTGGTGGGGTGGSGGTDAPGGSGGDLAPATVTWGACPDGPGVCTFVPVPVDWSEPEGDTLPFFVRKVPSATQPSLGQLWLLQGGPGSAGWMFAQVADDFAAMAPGYDLYIPDYRGVGYSAWLGCEGDRPDSLVKSCFDALLARWGDDLRHFSTSATVRDIHYVIESTRRPEDRVLLYGVSYGTFVLNRFLTLFPEAADGALLDSVCPARGCDIRMDHNANRVAEFAFGLCGEDAFCAGKLGGDPWGFLQDLLARIDAGHCSELYSPLSNRNLIETLVVFGVTDPQTLPLALATVYRMDRCAPEDVAALSTLANTLGGRAGGFDVFAGEESSLYLSDHVVFAEFWEEGLDKAKVEAELAELTFELGTLRRWANTRASWPWPIVPTPAAEKRWSGTATPLLLLNGDLDYQTHLNGLLDVEESFVNGSQHYVQVPLAGHGVLFSSQIIDGRTYWTCGMQMAAGFFADPQAPVDTSCLDRVEPIRFTGSGRMASWLMGTSDLWENGTGAGTALRAPLLPGEERAVQALVRRINERPSF